MTDISEEMKEAGFVYREPDKNHPKYELVEKLLKNIYTIDPGYSDSEETQSKKNYFRGLEN